MSEFAANNQPQTAQPAVNPAIASTAKVAGQAWHNLGEVILVENDEEMVRVSDQIASEHLEVQTQNPDWFLTRLTNYGSLF